MLLTLEVINPAPTKSPSLKKSHGKKSCAWSIPENMAVVYATLIIKGKKTFAEVPARIKEQVKQVLIDLDCGDLADE